MTHVKQGDDGEESSQNSEFDVGKRAQEYIDRELENLEKLKRTPYTDGWAEDKWQEEMERHPFFMTKAPDPTAELHPLLEGLQQLKYSKEENTANDLAVTHKDDGLLSFKLGKYRDAITNFTAGIKLDCSAEIKSQLLNNRGASHFFLSNYRSALLDSQEALKLNPKYIKAKVRVVQCLYHLEKFQECIQLCDDILKEDEKNIKIVDLRKDAVNKKRIQDRDTRKQRKKEEEDEKLLDAIRKRKFPLLIQGTKLTSVSQLDPLPIPPSTEPIPVPRVYLNEDRLVWPAIFTFPQHYMFECVQSFPEDVSFLEILEEVFTGIHSDWDVEKLYHNNTINIYFKNQHLLPVKISIKHSLLEAQQHPKYFQDSGVPCFFILVKGSNAEMNFIEESERLSRA